MSQTPQATTPCRIAGIGAARASRLRLPQLDRYGERTLHLFAVVAALWAVLIVGILSLWRASDFAHFYTIATLAAEGRFTALVSTPLCHARQVILTGGDGIFPAVYGPQVALGLAPLGLLPGGMSQICLLLTTAGAMAWCLWALVVRRTARINARFWRSVVLTLAAPAMLYAGAMGHLSAFATVAVTACCVALERRNRVLAGCAVGLLAYKPTLFVPAVAVLVCAGEWRMVAGAIGVGAGQVLVTIPLVGWEVVRQYVLNLWALAGGPQAMAAKPHLMASWRTFWSLLLPERLASLTYAAMGAATVVVAAAGWRKTADTLARVAILSLAVVLVAPHLYFYDLLILAPAFVLWAAKAGRSLAARGWLGAAYLAPLLAPVAWATHVQVVTLILAGWFGATVAQAWENR